MFMINDGNNDDKTILFPLFFGNVRDHPNEEKEREKKDAFSLSFVINASGLF